MRRLLSLVFLFLAVACSKTGKDGSAGVFIPGPQGNGGGYGIAELNLRCTPSSKSPTISEVRCKLFARRDNVEKEVQKSDLAPTALIRWNEPKLISGRSFTVVRQEPGDVSYFAEISLTEASEVQFGFTASQAGVPTTEKSQDLPLPASCVANPDQFLLPIPTDSASNGIGSVPFRFLVSSGEDIELYQVTLGGAPLAVALPTERKRSHILTLEFNRPGTFDLEFHVRGANGVGSCRQSVGTFAQPVAAPVLTSLTASSTSIDFGGSVLFQIEFTGDATSADLNGTPIPLSGHTGEISLTPSATGSRNYVATVRGAGGSTSRQVAVKVNPTCTLAALTSSQAIDARYGFSVSIAGGFTSASLSGPGLETLGLAAANGYSGTISPMVTSVAGVGAATLAVTGPNQTSARCTTAIRTTEPPVTSVSCDTSWVAGMPISDPTYAYVYADLRLGTNMSETQCRTACMNWIQENGFADKDYTCTRHTNGKCYGVMPGHDSGPFSVHDCSGCRTIFCSTQ